MDHFILRVYVPSALKRHPNGNGIPVRITHWKVYGSTKIRERKGSVIIKIQYSLVVITVIATGSEGITRVTE